MSFNNKRVGGFFPGINKYSNLNCNLHWLNILFPWSESLILKVANGTKIEMKFINGRFLEYDA